mmetsp:Transcript_39517/g.77909  ORF Transcript_39517/g.77909 Transcript_39517/m.77909 type:complete len:379 (-) Transcript_39517:109-1245(-)
MFDPRRLNTSEPEKPPGGYAGRNNANSPEWPEIFTVPFVPRVRHETTGQPYRVSRQQAAWKQPWGFPGSYMVQPSVTPEPLREPSVLPQWRETAQLRPCSVYGSATTQFQATMGSLMRGAPETVFSDPNNPLLKQLVAEKNRRDQSALLQNRGGDNSPSQSSRGQDSPFKEGAHSYRTTSTQSAAVSQRTPPSWRRPGSSSPPSSSSPSSSYRPNTAPGAAPILSERMAVRCAQYNVTVAPSHVPLVDDLLSLELSALAKQDQGSRRRCGSSSPSALRAHAASPTATRGKTATTGPVRYGLVNSIATQPEPPSKAWVTIPLTAIAREEQSQANKGAHRKREAVPLHGELRDKNHAATKNVLRRKQVTRDVAAVADLVW